MLMQKQQNLYAIGQDLAGQRLDRAIGRIIPGMSLRAARRIIADGRVLVNNKRAGPAMRLFANYNIAILPTDSHAQPNMLSADAEFLGRLGKFVFFYKPPGLHSARLAGRDNMSLECMLPQLLLPYALPNASLLQRLDRDTGGIVTGAISADAAAAYARWQNQGKTRKYYLALLAGCLTEPCAVKNQLNCANRKITSVTANTASPLRWTYFRPLAVANGQTLAQAQLSRGSRHQIRAHAASIGLPLAGDELYGGGQGKYILEHYAIVFAGYHFLHLRGDFHLSPQLKDFAMSDKLLETISCMS